MNAPKAVAMGWSVEHVGRLVAQLADPRAVAILAESYGAGARVRYKGQAVAQIDVTGQRLDVSRLEAVVGRDREERRCMPTYRVEVTRADGALLGTWRVRAGTARLAAVDVALGVVGLPDGPLSFLVTDERGRERVMDQSYRYTR